MRSIVKSELGVTLVELMVVVAILAAIAAIALALYADTTKKARLAADQGTLAAIRSAIAIYYGQNDGAFPTQAALSSGPPLLQATPDWQRPPNTGWTYDGTNGLAALAVNDLAGC